MFAIHASFELQCVSFDFFVRKENRQVLIKATHGSLLTLLVRKQLTVSLLNGMHHVVSRYNTLYAGVLKHPLPNTRDKCTLALYLLNRCLFLRYRSAVKRHLYVSDMSFCLCIGTRSLPIPTNILKSFWWFRINAVSYFAAQFLTNCRTLYGLHNSKLLTSSVSRTSTKICVACVQSVPTSIGVARGDGQRGHATPKFQHIVSFCASRGGVPNRTGLLIWRVFC